MTPTEIANERLFNQHLIGAKYALPIEVVRALGAVQSQDYAGAKWGLGSASDIARTPTWTAS